MEIEKTFTRLLELNGEWRIVEVSFKEAEKRFVIEVEETGALWSGESLRQGGSVSCYDHVGPLRWRHLNVFNCECDIECRLPRGKRADGRVYRVTPPWEGKNKHFTKEFEAFALALMREMPVSRAGEILGEGDMRMWSMVHRHVDAARPQVSMAKVRAVGADEMSRAKGHRYVTVFADMEERKVLFATPGRDSATWTEFGRDLASHGGDTAKIEEISMDMSPAYMKGAAEQCPQASIVFDKFHVVAHANEAVNKVRKLELKRGAAGNREQVEGTRWLFRKNPENWSDGDWERYDRIDLESLRTGQAYSMRLSLQDIYQKATGVIAARRRFKLWISWVRRASTRAKDGLLMPMRRLADMVESHLDGIVAHWKRKTTNAFMEGLNSVFSAVKRKARGYRTEFYLINMLYFVASKLPIPMATYGGRPLQVAH
ncbi:MAG: ISL3 family transposase [Candidatus Omnitrophica bacterium]|nr:ISL3 family transposase [Candidatus Omnitrophota bacterium]